MSQNPTIDQLVKMLGEQQKLVQAQSQQIAQFIANQNAPTAVAPPQNQANFVPSLPDISPFEPTDDKSRIAEWIERFKFALDCAAPTANEEVKVKCLMNKLSEIAFSEYSRSVLPSLVTDFGFIATTEKLEKLFAKPQSIFIDRFECLKAVRGEGEEFRQFINRHRKLLANFKFDELKKEQFNCLMLLMALKSPNEAALRQRILTKLSADGVNVSYDNVVEDLINYQSTIAESKTIEAPIASRNVNAVHQNGKQPNSPMRHFPKFRTDNSASKKCWRCGGMHRPDDCRHKTSKCRKCEFVGHLERQCESVQEWRKHQHAKKTGNKRVGHLRIGMTMRPVNSFSLLQIEILLNKKPVKVFLDTGSDVNVIDEETHVKIGRPPIEKCNEIGKAFDGTKISFIGKGFGTFKFGKIEVEQAFYVAKIGSLNLLSCRTMDEFGLLKELKEKIDSVKVNACQPSGGKAEKFIPTEATQIAGTKSQIQALEQSFKEIFDENLGHCTKEKAHLILKEDVRPVYRKARPVPYNSLVIVERELDRLEKMDVIRKVEHLEWAAPILIVKKADGSARLCIDYSTGLNEALLDCQYPLPIPEDIFATLNGGKIFSQIDLRDAYFQIELDDESKKLCGLATHKGNYRMQRLPFGVKTAPAIFQSVMDKMLAGLDYATAYLDDIIIVSKNISDHSKHLEEVFGRLKAYGFRVKLTKCKFFRDQIKYLGQIIDKNGRRPDPSKIHAIGQMPAPKDIPQLRSFLGMVNHYQQFVKNLRFVRKPLDDMLKKETDWNWAEECQNAFRKIKEILTSNLLLTHYDPKMEIIVAADASEMGIGAVISHKFPDGTIKAIAHASKSLSPAEKNYSQIEKEGLALIFAVQKFHKMIYGRHFTLQTDHKPLVSIFGNKKGIRQCSANRLLRWSLILLAYDFAIEYINTNDFGQADALSRLIAKGNECEDERIIATINAESDFETNFAKTIANLPITFSDLVTASEKDEAIVRIQKFISTGWPNEKAMAKESQAVRVLSRRKEELSNLKGCLMYGERVIIPKVFQSKILNLLHKGHPGMKRMKQLARQYVFWPMIDQDIEEFVKECVPCQLAAKAPVKTNLHSWPKPMRPWQRVHVDFAGPFFGKQFLIVVDSFSKYPEVFEMSTISATATIEKMRYLSTRHGIPETLVSDNGTQFKSIEFAKFTAVNGINHLFSAPYHPMSNGQAERFVDTFKRAFRKLKGEGMSSCKEIIETFLVTYRTTPNDSLPDSKCPAEMLLGRKPRTTLDLLKPPSHQPDQRDQAMERKFNRRFGTRPQIFASKDAVWARHRLSQNWKPGTICGCSGVIYNVRFDDGTSGRYHANQLRLRKGTGMVEDPLKILNEEFNLPIRTAQMEEQQQDRQDLGNRPDPTEHDVGDQQHAENEQDEHQTAVTPPPRDTPRRYPLRRRQPPARFSPS